MKTSCSILLVSLSLCLAFPARGADAPDGPLDLARRLEARMAAGEGVMLPDADAALERPCGAIDPASGAWPDAFLDRLGQRIFVAVSPETGAYEFFDEAGDVFWTVTPVLPTTENWVAPFRRFTAAPSPDDALYAPWRLVDVWTVGDVPSSRAPAPAALRRTRSSAPPSAPTNLCFTAFSFTEERLLFTADWPADEDLPGGTLDLYACTNLATPRWVRVDGFAAVSRPATFELDRTRVPGWRAPVAHEHDATCSALTNVVVSPLDGIRVYTNVSWSCAGPRTSETAFFRLGTRLDSDADGAPDALERLVLETDPDDPDSDGDGVPDGMTPEAWRAHPLWGENAGQTNLVIALTQPVAPGGRPVLTLGDLPIPLATGQGLWAFGLPPGEIFDCRLSNPGSTNLVYLTSTAGCPIPARRTSST